MGKPILKALGLFIQLFLLLGNARAELMNSDLGFYLDPPEGYSLASAPGAGKYQFVDSTGKAFLSVVAYEESRFRKAGEILEDLKARLKAQAQGSALSFQGRDAFYGRVSFAQSGVSYSGFVFCLAGGSGERDYLALSYSDAASFGDYADFLSSAIDSFSPDYSALRYPGPASWNAAPFDAKDKAEARLEYGGKALSFPLGRTWAKASQDLIEREARVLSAYGDEPEMWQGAWTRYYRMVYRDSYHRLDALAFALGVEIEGANGRMADRGRVEAALEWVQGFTFTRSLSGSDLLNPIDCALKADGDCDARALLLAILLHHWNVDAGMAVSHEYSHAVGLVDLPGTKGFNAGIEADGKRYLVAETTAKVKPGLIDEAQSDPAKWIGIGFYF